MPTKEEERKFEIYGDIDRPEYIRNQKARGFEIVVPGKDELQIDIDSEEEYQKFWKRFECLQYNGVDAEIIYDQPSKSGKNGRRHIVIKMPIEMDPVKRIAFQAALGSDWVRELLSLLRFENGDVDPTLFVEKKENGNGKKRWAERQPI